jgi:hypothetical protein
MCLHVTKGLIIILSLFLSSCSFLLPYGTEKSSTEWKSYTDVKAAYQSVILDETTEKKLWLMGFNPTTSSNISIEDYNMIQKRFDPLLTHKNLPKPILKCIQETSKCVGYYVQIRDTSSERVGNSFLDIFNFKRVTHQTGWDFKALFIIINKKVIFKLSNSSPNINYHKTEVNPLGPLQDGVDFSVGFSYDLNKE